jgi:hypothetical protein
MILLWASSTSIVGCSKCAIESYKLLILPEIQINIAKIKAVSKTIAHISVKFEALYPAYFMSASNSFLSISTVFSER